MTITETTWKRVCYTIIVLLLPYLFYGLIDGREWIAWVWWVVALAVVWLTPRRRI